MSTEIAIPRCPTCDGPGVGADSGGLLYTCSTCAVTFIPTGAGMVGLVQRTASDSQLVVDRVPLSAAFTGRYRISRLVGSGGMGTVYLGRDRLQDRDVCVKFLYRIEDKELLVRFLREGKMLAQIQDPHVVQLLEVGESSDFPYLVMEHVSGGTLRERLNRARPPAPSVLRDMNATVDLGRPEGMQLSEAIGWMRQILVGLSACHERGIVHRDLKPENVLVTADGEAKLGDLGIGKDLADSGTMLTRTGEVMGTPTYVSPEQIRGDPVGFTSDVYSFGVMAYELLNGSPPCVSFTLHDIIRWHKEEEAVPLVERKPEVGGALSGLVGRCLAKDPSARPPDAAACLRELDSIAGGVGTPGRRRMRAVALTMMPALAVVGGWAATRHAVDVWTVMKVSPIAMPTPVTKVSWVLPFPLPASPDAAHLAWEEVCQRAERATQGSRAVTLLPAYLEALRLAEPLGDQRLAYSLQNLGILYLEQGRVDLAKAALLRAREILKTHPSSLLSASIEGELSNIAQSMGEKKAVEEHSRSSLRFAEGSGEAGTYSAVAALLRLAQSRCGEGAIEESRTLLERVLKQLETIEAEEPMAFAYMLSEVAELQLKLQDDAQAEKTWRRQLALHERLSGASSEDVARTLMSLASFHETVGRHAEAEPLLVRAHEILVERTGENSLEVASCLELMAQLALGQMDGEAAYRHATAAMGMHVQDAESPSHDPRPIASMRLLRGRALEMLERPREALVELRLAVDLEERVAGEFDEPLIHARGEAARLEFECGDEARGKSLIQAMIAQLDSGKLESAVAFGAIEQIGLLLEMIHDLDGAQRIWEKGLKSLESSELPHDQFRLSFLFGVARSHLMRRDPDRAAPLVAQALELWDAHAESHMPHEADLMGQIADLYRELRRSKDVVIFLERRLLVLANHRGKSDPETLAARMDLGESRLQAGDAQGAILDFEACMKDGKPAPGLDAEKTRWLLEGHAEALSRVGKEPR